jgi:hypothetical protein
MDVTSKPDLGAFSQFSATIMVATPMALLVSLALLFYGGALLLLACAIATGVICWLLPRAHR